LPRRSKRKGQDESNQERFMHIRGPMGAAASWKFQNHIGDVMQAFSPFLSEEAWTDKDMSQMGSLMARDA
jgi:hypothetical protein